MPIELRDDGLLQFADLMSIHKIMQPRIDPLWLAKRRELFRLKDWKSYETHMRTQLESSVKIAEQGYQSLNKILAIDVSQVRQSVNVYSLDLDKRDIFEKFMATEVAPADEPSRVKRSLTKQETLDAISKLNEAHITCF